MYSLLLEDSYICLAYNHSRPLTPPRLACRHNYGQRSVHSLSVQLYPTSVCLRQVMDRNCSASRMEKQIYRLILLSSED